MTEPNEDPKPEPKSVIAYDNTFDITHYKNRFEEAVLDAQFMLDYAASNTGSVIDPLTLKRLITARQIIEKGQKLSADEETEFWIAYQDLWEIVSPATAESIKANLLIEDTFISRLIGYFPGLSHWLGKGTTSRARRTVGWYIVFTIFVLIFLLSFQIYWVVGNQLIADMGQLSQRQDFLKSQLVKSVSNPDSQLSQASLEAELDTLESKHERYAAILWLWSKPWNGYIEVVRKDHDPKFESRFVTLELQITEIENKKRDDPDGSREAGVNAQQNDLETKLAAAQKANNTTLVTEIQAQIDSISNISTLEADLIKLTAEKADIEGQIKSKTEEMENNKKLITTLTADMNTKNENIKSLTEENANIQGAIEELEAIDTNIDEVLSPYGSDAATPSSSSSEKLADAAMEKLPESLRTDLQNQTDLAEQIKYLKDYKISVQQQLEYLEGKQREIENQIAQLEADVKDFQNRVISLNDQITTLDGDITKLGTDSTTKQTEIATKNTEIGTNKNKIEEFKGAGDAAAAAEIVKKRDADLQKLESDLYDLSLEEQEYLDRTDSTPAQLAGQFVLNILQSYFLPILYGLLGASTSVLRSLSRQINNVTFSEKTGIQHLLSISLGALAGIVVGWFSFLIDAGNSFLGSVSPLAIAFLVGYNIDPFFSRMDLIMKRENESSPTSMSATKKEATSTAPHVESRTLLKSPLTQTEAPKEETEKKE